VRKGKGTAGALLVDPQIYDDLKELVRDLKRNPWKFFWKE
jgi:phospholipid/cholesterol/gamma-HCH transport system substrate-binding protein